MVLDTGDLTAIEISGEFGRIAVFNIYNNCHHSRILHTLDNFIKTNRTDVCAGPREYFV